MNTSAPLAPTQDERVMAALAHMSALLPLMGVIAPIVIWVTQKDKSPYVAFQALQAIAYQILMILAWFLGMGCYMCSFFGTFVTIPFASTSEQTMSPVLGLTFIIPFLIFGAIFIGGFFFVLYGFIAAVLTLQGKPFRYILLGDRVERFMRSR